MVKDYLANRKQCTQLGRHCSELVHVNYGVPQGVVLGPLLFINICRTITDSGKIIAFAFEIITLITNKVNANNPVLYKIGGFIGVNHRKMLYNAFTHLHINYCLQIWAIGYMSHYNKLVTAQNTAAGSAAAEYLLKPGNSTGFLV